MNLVMIQPNATFAVQRIYPPAPLDAVTDASKPIEYETVTTKLDSVFVVGDIQYRLGYCERTDTMFRSRILT